MRRSLHKAICLEGIGEHCFFNGEPKQHGTNGTLTLTKLIMELRHVVNPCALWWDPPLLFWDTQRCVTVCDCGEMHCSFLYCEPPARSRICILMCNNVYIYTYIYIYIIIYIYNHIYIYTIYIYIYILTKILISVVFPPPGRAPWSPASCPTRGGSWEAQRAQRVSDLPTD